MMIKDNNNKLLRVRHIIENNALDVEDLCLMLEVTVEDMMDRFPDRLVEHSYKFEPDGYSVEESDYLYDNEETDEEEMAFEEE